MESKLFRLKRIRAQIWRFLPVAFLILSLVLVVLTKTGNSVIESAKRESVSIFAPVVGVISKPVEWLKDMAHIVVGWTSLYDENKRLKNENEKLLKWRSLALTLLEEQKELKEYLNYAEK